MLEVASYKTKNRRDVAEVEDLDVALLRKCIAQFGDKFK